MNLLKLRYRIHSLNHNMLAVRWFTLICCLDAHFWGVKIGCKSRFWGRTRFSVVPGSKITFGNECRFRSDTISNPVGINRPCLVSTHDKNTTIRVGNNCGFSGTVIAAKEEIVIDDHVRFGANTTVTDFDWHAIDPNERIKGVPGKSSPIYIKRNVWLGMNVTVLKGTIIGENSVVAAGSIVTKTLPPNVLAAGIPAKVIKILNTDQSI